MAKKKSSYAGLIILLLIVGIFFVYYVQKSRIENLENAIISIGELGTETVESVKVRAFTPAEAIDFIGSLSSEIDAYEAELQEIGIRSEAKRMKVMESIRQARLKLLDALLQIEQLAIG